MSKELILRLNCDESRFFIFSRPGGRGDQEDNSLTMMTTSSVCSGTTMYIANLFMIAFLGVAHHSLNPFWSALN